MRVGRSVGANQQRRNIRGMEIVYSNFNFFLLIFLNIFVAERRNEDLDGTGDNDNDDNDEMSK